MEFQPLISFLVCMAAFFTGIAWRRRRMRKQHRAQQVFWGGQQYESTDVHSPFYQDEQLAIHSRRVNDANSQCRRTHCRKRL